MKVRLDVIAGGETGRRFDFSEPDIFLVGRSSKAHFRFDGRKDPRISRNHFLLEIRPPQCRVRDFGSTNGTRVNGEKVQVADLQHGDVVRVGRTEMRFDIIREDEPGEASVRCASCGRAVSDLPGNVPEGALTGITYICPECQAKDRLKRKARRERPRRRPAIRETCSRCGDDMGAAPNADSRAAELHGVAVYICPKCRDRIRDSEVTPGAIGDYQLLGELGRGGMGVVYQAVHQPTSRLVALKQVLPDAAMDKRANKLFLREMGVMANLIHPNLVRFYDQGEHKGQYYFVSEFLSGGDFERQVMRRFHGQVPPEIACPLICQVLEGLEFAHQQGFIHRDLKPGNFLISAPVADAPTIPDPAARGPESSGPRAAKVADFGLAKSYVDAGGSSLTKPDHFGGTLMFMAPEQILDYRFVKPPADVYAVGVSLYYMLTGRYTVDFPSPAEQLARARAGKAPPRDPLEYIMDDPPIPVRKRKPDLPKPLAAVVDRSVQKEMDRRYQSAAEFMAAIEQVMAKP